MPPGLNPAFHACLLLCLTLGVGCAGYKAPTVRVKEAARTRMSDEAVALAFVLELENPNPIGIELDEFTYTISIDGTKVYAGRRAAEATLGASKSRQLTIPAVVPFHLVGWTARTIPARAVYRIDGELRFVAPTQIAQILFDTGVFKPKVGFSDEGHVAFE